MVPPAIQQSLQQTFPFGFPSLKDGQIQHGHIASVGRTRQLPYRESRLCNQTSDNTNFQAARSPYSTLTPRGDHSSGMLTMQVANQEHMLRRKTPSGTLAAAYDGRPQEWNACPPASKIPRQTSAAHEVFDSGWYQHSSAGLRSGPVSDTHGGWLDLPPLSASPYPWFGGMQVPTVLQPAWQPATGPTASNPSQFYGPYWPDGSYAPYKPASIRDIDRQGNQIRANNGAAFPSLSHLNTGGRATMQGSMFDTSYGDHLPNKEQYNRDSNNGSIQLTSLQNQGSSCTNLQGPAVFNHSSCSMTWESRNYTPMLSGKRANLHFKDKALAWAQRVYVDLLAQLQHNVAKSHQRKRSHGHPRSRSQPNIYPSLPRQANRGSESDISERDRRHRSGHSGHYSSASFSASGMIHISDRNSSSHTQERRFSASPLPSANMFGPDTHARNPAYQGHSHPLTNRVANIEEQARAALEMLNNLCQESKWSWIDGMLLGGCLAYGLENYQMALNWYSHIISLDSCHVEAISNLAATLLALNRREEAEQHWLRAVRLRPNYFEAVEHLIGLLCGEHRSSEAVGIIEFVEKSLRIRSRDRLHDHRSDLSSDEERSSCFSSSYTPSSETASFDFDEDKHAGFMSAPDFEGNGHFESFGTSGYRIAATENGRMLALVHAKGNLLYGLGDIEAASQAFEDAVLISTGRHHSGIGGLISKILKVVSKENSTTFGLRSSRSSDNPPRSTPILLSPDMALQTASLVFGARGELPGLKHLSEGMAKKAALATTSNSLLSLAKIFQDSLSSANSSVLQRQRPTGIGDILALYYLSLSLQPSPSTANNVGILLASVQQPRNQHQAAHDATVPAIPGVVPGSGVALALAYYNYGLNLDSRHAHLFTNLGSLLKDIGQLNAAIKMYEQAVSCDGTFDIALANLANAVKDQGRISDAISYYKRAVASSPDFAEAVCGLANALNSVCDWTDRGGVILENGRYERWHVDEHGMMFDSKARRAASGWMKRVVDIVGKQLLDGANWGRGILQEHVVRSLVTQLELADSGTRWSVEKFQAIHAKLSSWAGCGWEGARVVRLVERAVQRSMHRWYKDKFILNKHLPKSVYPRPVLPTTLSMPGAPTVLPFHTFTCPLSAKDIRMISERNALRISCSTLRASWLPAYVYPPPAPPDPCLNIGYVSSDFNNHPLAHLMQSVFGLHDVSKAKAFCYATTPSDNSVHRQQIEREAPIFHDASNWSSDRLIHQIVEDGIHILVNLNGYTRGARNEIFAARPAPIQMSFMGFAGTLGAEWCDYLLADEIAIPPETLRPWRRNVDIEDQLSEEHTAQDEQWVYSENIIFCRDTFFCCDHRQSSNDTQLPWIEEQGRRWQMRRELFPNLPDTAIILGNFNQLYKIEPTTFRTWLRILAKVPKAILWLLRFPDLGESNLKRTARAWAGDEVASRIWFTDVAPKGQHISRARVCDLFLDTPECNAHTTAADVLWSSTPLLTLPRYKYKMCSRMAASILTGALPKTSEGRRAGKQLIAKDEDEYEEYAVTLASGLNYDQSGFGSGRLIEIRRLLYESRHTSALFDTGRWVRDLEEAYSIAWTNWVEGKGGDIHL